MNIIVPLLADGRLGFFVFGLAVKKFISLHSLSRISEWHIKTS